MTPPERSDSARAQRDPSPSSQSLNRRVGRAVEEMLSGLPPAARRWLRAIKIDPGACPAPPSTLRWVTALIVANAGSLISDAILVTLGRWIFPSTQNFQHFQAPPHGSCSLLLTEAWCTDPLNPSPNHYTEPGADGEIRTPGQRFTKPLLYH